MHSINNSSVPTNKKKFYIKRKELNFVGFPKIHFPFLQRNQSNFNNYQEAKLIKKYNDNFAKLKNNSSNMIYNQKILRIKSSSGNHINNLIKKNRKTAENLTINKNNKMFENLNTIWSYSSLTKIWTEFNVTESYKNFFNLILNKLNEEEREDMCLKEFKDLNELKNNINSLIKEIQLRKKSLEDLFKLNNLLKDDENSEENAINEQIIKEISEQIINLRMHSVNICFKMKKIKNKIYEGYIYGKFDLDDISKIFGFDKDYLIKMKEEMNFLKDGKIKSYFNIGSNPDPFLTKASENRNNANNDFTPNLIPMSKELEESIKQCNYFIYQDLIYYQTNNNRINIFMFNQGAYNTKNSNDLKEINKA